MSALVFIETLERVPQHALRCFIRNDTDGTPQATVDAVAQLKAAYEATHYGLRCEPGVSPTEHHEQPLFGPPGPVVSVDIWGRANDAVPI